MADVQKFLNSAGVSTLWGEVIKNIKAEETRAKAAEEANAAAAKKAQDEVDALKTLAGTLPEDTTATTIVEYVDKKTTGIATSEALGQLQTTVGEHTTALATLNGDAETTGSVANTAVTAAAAKVAEIVAGADEDFDTLKEIADWILSDTTGAAALQADVSTLKNLVGSTAVATQISDAINTALKVDGVDKYALASDLSSLADRVKALEDAGHVTQAAIDTALGTAKTYAEEKAAAAQSAAEATAAADATSKANAAESNAKAHADGLNTAMDTRVKALEAIDHTKFESAGAAETALEAAKSYTDAEIAKIQALTPDEVLAAISAVSAE